MQGIPEHVAIEAYCTKPVAGRGHQRVEELDEAFHLTFINCRAETRKHSLYPKLLNGGVSRKATAPSHLRHPPGPGDAQTAPNPPFAAPKGWERIKSPNDPRGTRN